MSFAHEGLPTASEMTLLVNTGLTNMAVLTPAPCPSIENLSRVVKAGQGCLLLKHASSRSRQCETAVASSKAAS
jgi:hypothetical protein